MKRVSNTCTMVFVFIDGWETNKTAKAMPQPPCRAAHQLHHIQEHVESALPVAKRNLNIVTQASGKFPINSDFVKQSSHGVT